MTTKTNDSPVLDETSAAEELRAACAAARAEVAARPLDEEPAQALREVVSRASGALAASNRRPPPSLPPEIARAAKMLAADEIEPAEVMLRRRLIAVPNDPDAMLLMAEIAMRCDFPENAEKILRRSVELHRERTDNRMALAKLLHHNARKFDKVALVDDALVLLDEVLTLDPDDEEALRFQAALLVQLRKLPEARSAFERLLEQYPENAIGWIDYGHLLKTLGHFGEAVAAFRTGLALDPANGPGWSMLADLKLARFFPADIGDMEAGLEQPLPEVAKVSLHFALSSAYHQAKNYEKAAAHLREGNALRLKANPHDVALVERGIQAAIRTYTPAFFAARAGKGDPSPDPIFVVGMPRSGSTLVEQILSSHDAIEGTAELFGIQQIEAELMQQQPGIMIDEIIGSLDVAALAPLGARYLELTRFHRRTDRPRFTDKNPGNWRQAAFIHVALPNARIIDVRRNPLDCCFANYSQHFAAGVNYSYGLKEMASQYGQYVRLMRHFDEVTPGVVHRIIYDDLVDDLEPEVRRLFAYLDLPFQEASLRFYENERAVHTPSSEQVRQPINRSGMGKWKKYEPWLGELREALGDLVHDWRR